jgi:hypothetical protein
VKIVEKSADRLTVQLSQRTSSRVCALDRARDTTTVTQFAFIIPFRRSQVPLSDVRTAFVERRRGQTSYYAILETRRGSKIAIGECTKEDALAVVKAIRDFLGIRDEALQA